MLHQLCIRNFALIEEVQVELGPGLNVLTGETGAGKSIVIDAVALLLGGRASADLIRQGTEKAQIDGIFICADGDEALDILRSQGIDPEPDGILILCREIAGGGRSTCRINGRVVTLSSFQEVGRSLVDLHGQHDQHSLFRQEKQLLLLDHFGGKEHGAIRRQLEDTYHHMCGLQRRIKELNIDEHSLARQLDLLNYQAGEIDGIQPSLGEEEALTAERQVLAHAEKLAVGAEQVYQGLFGGGKGDASAHDSLSKAVQQLREMTAFDPSLTDFLDMVQTSLYQIEEAARGIKGYAGKIEFNPQRLEDIEGRLHSLQKLQRKYGKSVSDVLAYRRQIADEMHQLNNLYAERGHLELELGKIEGLYDRISRDIHGQREQLARHLEKEITSILVELEMPHARMEIELVAMNHPGPSGADEAKYLFSSNPGEALRPLARIASGGELSRVMLAIKNVLANADRVPTLIFDEIDAGIGGRTVQFVGQKLAALARHHQILCVTHAPQIASYADHHFYIAKEISGERTRTKISSLEREGKIRELARMLAGNTTDLSLQHAEELINLAVNEKCVG
ncbi:MAG: DNA repair protein RecN [Bacillota bacterium]